MRIADIDISDETIERLQKSNPNLFTWGFAVGDTVLVTHRPSENEMGRCFPQYFNCWTELMDKSIGKMDKVISINRHGIYLKNCPLGFPPCSLKRIGCELKV